MFKLKETIPGTERASQLSSDMNKTTTIKKLNKQNKNPQIHQSKIM